MNGYWDLQLAKVDGDIVPDAEFVNEYNVFIEKTTNIPSKKDYNGVVTPLVTPSSGSLVIFTGEAFNENKYQNDALIGVNLEFLTLDGDIFTLDQNYTFDAPVGQISFIDFIPEGGEVIKAFYTTA